LKADARRGFGRSTSGCIGCAAYARFSPANSRFKPQALRPPNFLKRWPATTDRTHPDTEHTMGEFTKHQQKIIKNYYDNRESIALQKVQEFVTELYLSEGKKRVKYWKSIAGHLEKLGVDKKTIDHLVSQDKPELVASLVKKLMDKH
jgi:hypothetical protein